MATKYINTEFEAVGGLNLSTIADGSALSNNETKALFLDANGDIGYRTVGTAAFTSSGDYVSSSNLDDYLPLAGGTMTGSLQVSVGGAVGINLKQDTGTSANSGRLFFSNATSGQGVSIFNSSGAMRFQTGATFNNTTGTTRMIIGTGGNVGIGTTSPGFTNGGGLEIEQSGTATLRLQSAGSNASELFQTTTGFTIADLSSGVMAFRVSNTEKMRLTSTGLGVNTTSPGGILDADGQYGDLTIGDPSIGSRITYYDTTRILLNSNEIRFYTNSLTERLRIDSSGNVGIGTTSPDQKLQVIGDISLGKYDATDFDRRVGLNSSNGGYSAGSSYIRFQELSATGTSGTTKGCNIRFYNHLYSGGTNETLTIQANGYVGIGTTSPAQKLHVKGAALRLEEASAARHLDIVPAVSGVNHRLTSTTTGAGFDFEYWNGSAATVMATISSGGITVAGSVGVTNIVTNRIVKFNGSILDDSVMYDDGTNVGIGTTSPDKQLHVRGSAPFIRIEEDSASEKRLDLWVDPSTAIAYVGANQSAQQLSFQTGNTDRIRITNGGNVGIGTATPSYKLDVSGDIRATGDLNAGDDVFIAGNTLRFTNDAASAYIQSVDTLYIEADSNINDTGGKPIIFRTAGTTKMTIAGDGDVTIDNDLIVSGDLTVSGTTTTLDTATLQVEDHNIEIGNVTTPSNTTANNGGITLLGGTDGDKKLTWTGSSNSWIFNTNLDVQGDFAATGSVKSEGPDGGMVMRTWQADSAYGMIGTANMASNEYALLTNGQHTYISGGSSGNVYIRGGNNDSSPQIQVQSSNIVFNGIPSLPSENTALMWDSSGNIGYRNLSTGAFAAAYSHPTHPGDDIDLDTTPLTGATIISDLDFNITTDTLGHVTDANASFNTRNLTPSDIGAASTAGPTFTGTVTVSDVLDVSGVIYDREYHHGGTANWKTKKYVRSVGGNGADTGGKWVHLTRVVIDVAYEKARIKFNINSYDDVSSGVEAIDVSYENGASSQEHHILDWYSTDSNAVLFSEVRSIRSSSSGLSNTYDLYVKIASDWQDTFTVVAESWVTHGSSTPITFQTSNGSTTTPTAGSDDKAATSRKWYTDNTDMYFGTNKVWHAGNDGPNSGLDADTLDGSHASAFSPVAGSTSLTTAGTLTVDQLNMRDAGDFITLYGNDDGYHAIGARNYTGGTDDDIRINSYGAVYINLDSNNNNTSTADFRIGRHGGQIQNGTISDWLFTVDGENGNVTVAGTVDGRDIAADGSKLDGIAAGANNYSHPTHPGDDFSVDSGPLTGATVISDIDINVTTDTLGHVTDANGTIATRTLTAANLGISAPNAPSNVSVSVVGETVSVSFDASTTSGIDSYLVYSSVDGSDYGLISIIPPDDFSATMEIIDQAFAVTGTQAYRVYAMKYGIMSSAATGSVSYTVSSAEPTDMTVVPLNNAYFVQWNPPSSNERFVTAYNVYKHEAAQVSSLARGSASLVYSGLNTNFMYQISGSNNNNYHQFWVETTIA